MPALTDEIKVFIVKALARYESPSQVVEAVKTTFDVEISRQQAYSYDPECSKPPVRRWQELHAAARQAFLTDLGQIGVAQKAFRLRMLDRLARRAEYNHYADLAASLLMQAAKECGGLYDRRIPPAPAPAPAPVPVPAPVPAVPPSDRSPTDSVPSVRREALAPRAQPQHDDVAEADAEATASGSTDIRADGNRERDEREAPPAGAPGALGIPVEAPTEDHALDPGGESVESDRDGAAPLRPESIKESIKESNKESSKGSSKGKSYDDGRAHTRHHDAESRHRAGPSPALSPGACPSAIDLRQ